MVILAGRQKCFHQFCGSLDAHRLNFDRHGLNAQLLDPENRRGEKSRRSFHDSGSSPAHRNVFFIIDHFFLKIFPEYRGKNFNLFIFYLD